MHTSVSEDGRLDAISHRELTSDVIGRLSEVQGKFRTWILILSVLSLLGVIGFIIRLNDGFDDRSKWGYLAATLAYITTIFVAAPIISIGQRYIKSHWRRPMTRVSEIYAITGMLGLLLLLPALAALPPLEGRADIWFDWPQWAPGGGNILAYGSLALCGIFLLWMLALPDLAAARDHLPESNRQKLISRLSLGWTGHIRQWRVHRWGLLTLGGCYILMFMLIQTLLTSDFSAGLLPGLKDAIFPAFQVIQGLQGATALVIVTMFILRTAGGYRHYLGVDQFWALSKPLLAFSLLWFYFWWSTFITFWYGRNPAEVSLLKFLMFDSYMGPFLIAFFLNFLIPLIGLIWNPVRRSVWGPTIIAVGILIGAFFNQIRMFVSAFSVKDVSGHQLHALEPFQWPGAPDILIAVGSISAAILMFMLVSKVVPIISIWEVGEGIPLTKVKRFLSRSVRVIAKSH